MCVELLLIIPVIVPCRQYLYVELPVIVPEIVTYSQHLCVELLVIIPVIFHVDSICV